MFENAFRFFVENLEEKFMLSSVQIFAAGTTGNEEFDLLVDDVVVASYSLSQSDQSVYTYNSPESISADQIKIEFTNDLYRPQQGIDYNLIVDKIIVDGQTLETEHPTTFSTGSWVPEIGTITPGNWQLETLNGNGYFQFSDQPNPADSIVRVIARGTTGDEIFNLEVNGQVVGSAVASTNNKTFIFRAPSPVSLQSDVVRVNFTNDLFVENVVNRDLIVDRIIIDGVNYQTEAPTTFSTGTWVNGFVDPGFLQTEVLTNNGYFEYSTPTNIVVRASGDEGTEEIQLQIDEETVATYELTTEFQEFTYTITSAIDPSQIRIVFEGDVFDPDNDIDKNANVDWIQIGSQRIRSDNSAVFSSGTWTSSDGIAPGFGRGSTLHSDGYFQYGIRPVADTFDIPEDSTLVPLAVLSNDNVGGTLAVEVTSSPTNGVATIVDGVLYYTPNSEFVGTDSLFYRQAGSSGAGTRVDINVLESHQQPQSLLDDRVASELTPSGKFLLVEKVAKIPRDQNGRQPRMNAMTTLGDRIFVVTDGSQNGEGNIYELVTDSQGATTAVLFLDVGAAVTNQTGLEIDNSSPLNGLRSLAFHPEFDSNGKFYVTYTGQRPSTPNGTTYLSDPANPVDVESVLAEFTYDFDEEIVDESSYREVFRVGMNNSEHSIRQAVFNPFANPGDEDYGLLYIGHGDGSEQTAIAGDGLNNDGLGKILRINPLASGNASYSVPTTNPFVGDPTMIDEVYALGFRNPTNLTFAVDSLGVARLIATDIGRDNIEEINLIVPGASYGWADREGPFVHGPLSDTINELEELPDDEADNGYTFPAALWTHSGVPGISRFGQAIAAGHVIQNGSSELDDQFVFLEFGTDGRAYHVDFSELLTQNTLLDPNDSDNDDPEDLTWLTPQELTILFDHDNDDSTTPLVRSSLKDVLDDEPDFVTILSGGRVRADLRLGQGPNGELYILNKRNGWVYVATNTQIEDAQVE